MPRKNIGTARKGGKKNNTQVVMWNKPQSAAQKKARLRVTTPVMQQNQSIRSRQPRTERQAGNAVRVRLPTVGMSDLIAHRITWVAGTVYVGNGTLGVTNSVYFANQAANAVYAAGTGGGFWIPFAPADADVGATYAAAIMKLYRRVRIRQARVHLRTVQSSTTNNLVVGIAPCRGPPGADEIAQAPGGTPTAQTLQNLMSVSGMQSCDSFENLTLDLTPYIAGGAGAQQNEFAVASPAVETTSISNTPNLLGSVPCAVQVAGNSTVSALQGSVTHNIICEMVCDLIDFQGAVPVLDPEELSRRGLIKVKESKEEKRTRLMGELTALVRNDNNPKRDASPPAHK